MEEDGHDRARRGQQWPSPWPPPVAAQQTAVNGDPDAETEDASTFADFLDLFEPQEAPGQLPERVAAATPSAGKSAEGWQCFDASHPPTCSRHGATGRNTHRR